MRTTRNTGSSATISFIEGRKKSHDPGGGFRDQGGPWKRAILAEGGDKACRRRCNADSITDRQSVDGYFGKFPCRHEHSCKTQRSWPSDSPCAGISLIVDDLPCRDLRRIADCGQSRMTIALKSALDTPTAPNAVLIGGMDKKTISEPRFQSQ